MKKGKFLSVLTSLAMTGTMILSAIPFGASAEDSPVELAMTSDKTTFSLDEVKAGNAKTSIYVDITSQLTEASEVTEIDFEIVPETWGKVDPKNVMLCDPNQLATPEGGAYLDEGFVCGSSGTASEWTADVTKPNVLYNLQDFKTSAGYAGYTDTIVPKAMLFTNSSLGYMITGDKEAGSHFAKFDVYLPSDLAQGEYDINFRNAKSILGNSRDDNVRTLSIANAKGITIKVGDGQQETTEAETTVAETTDTSKSYNYQGSADIWADTSVSAAVGETVNVPVYLDTHGKLIDGIGLAFTYDHDALKLTNILTPKRAGYDGSGLTGGQLSKNAEKDTANYQTTSKMTNDPSMPIMVLEFEVLEGAKGEYEIGFANHLGKGGAIEINYDVTDNSRLEAVIKNNGSVIVGDAVETTEAETTATETSKSYNYQGSADIWADTSVSAAVGETVNVPVYLDTHGKLIDGIGLAFTYDHDALKLTNILTPKRAGYDGSGLTGGQLNKNAEKDTANYQTTGKMTNDPSMPIMVLEFEVLEGAKGEYEIGFANHLGKGGAIEINYDVTDNSRLQAVIKNNGSIIVGEALESSTTEKPAETVVVTVPGETVVQTIPGETVVVTVPGETVVQTIPGETVVVTVPGETVVQTIPGETVVVTVPGETVVVTVPGETVVQTIPGETVVVTVPGETVVVTVPGETVVQTVPGETVVVTVPGETVVVTVPGQTVPGETVVVTLPGETVIVTLPGETVIVTVPVGSETTTVSTTEANTGETGVIEIEIGDLKADGNDYDWYFADEEAWHTDVIVVKVNGEVVENAADKLTFSAESPKAAYDGENFDYTITVTYTDENGNSASTEFTAKIGLRGDANCDHKANVRDAAAIAKDLAQMNRTHKSTLTAEDGFGIFLGNCDFVLGEKGIAKKPTDHYGIYELNVRDAAAIARWLSKLAKNPELTLYEVAVLGKN